MERWNPKVECSPREQRLLKLAGRSRRLFVFLREHRHELFDVAFQSELEAMYRRTGEGQERLRERVGVEHRLAHLAERQGPKARYRGTRRNVFDLRRLAAVQNLETVARRQRELLSAVV